MLANQSLEKVQEFLDLMQLGAMEMSLHQRPLCDASKVKKKKKKGKGRCHRLGLNQAIPFSSVALRYTLNSELDWLRYNEAY